MLFALVSATPLVHTGDLYRMRRALEQNARSCAESWSLEPPAVEVFPPGAILPAWCTPVVFVDEETDVGASAVHYVLPTLLPAARVYMQRASDLLSGDWAASVSASHEIMETLVDPGCDQWRDHPDQERKGVQIALEVGDPVQSAYVISGPVDDVSVSNFVTPLYFDPYGATKGKLDMSGELRKPGEIGPQGYAILRSATEQWLESSEGRLSRHPKPGATHPWARTVRRGAYPAEKTA